MLSRNPPCPVCQRPQPLRSNSVWLPRRLWNLDTERAVETVLLCDRCSKNAEDYCCISYVWANLDAFCFKLHKRTGNQTIIDQKGDFYRSLLTTICQAFRTSFLWFDRLCLPDNPEEKGPEIMLMGKYYHRARLCITLLNHVVANGDGASDKLNAGKIRWWFVSRGNDDFWYYSWAIERLNSDEMCEDSWFERVWTAQEFCRSRWCIAWDGHNSLNLTRLAAVLLSAEGSDPIAVKKGLHSLPQAFVETMLLWRDGFFDGLDLATALWMTESRKCRFEEDRVYGILGLLKHPLQFPVAYNIGLEDALLRALKAAIEIGDISFLTAVDDGSHLFPSYNALLKRCKALRLGNIGPGRCELSDKGVSLPIIHQVQAASIICGKERGKEEEKANFHVRVYLSILRWLAFLVDVLNAAALSTLVECFSPSEKERPQLIHWFKQCIACPVDEASIQNLCIDMPDIVFLLIGRRLLRDHEWVFIDLKHEVDGVHPRFVLASMVSIPQEPIGCLFLDVSVREGSNKLFFLLCIERDGVWSRVGCGVCDGRRSQYPTTRVIIT